ncbi:UNVERIFIED_CONTAM: hypothetical protein HDU68_011303, partial [Siphonaria sp. JEL0065]
MHKTADTLELSKFSGSNNVKADIKMAAKWLQKFQKHYIPVLFKAQERLRQLLNKYGEKVKNNPSSYTTATDLSSYEFGLDDSYLGNSVLLGIGHKSKRNGDYHEDFNNFQYGYNCVMVFGDFEGGPLQFIDLGFEIEVWPGDLVVFDAAKYRHRVGKVKGDRYSLIFFNCKHMVGKLFEEFGLNPSTFRRGFGVDKDGWFTKP